MFPLVHALLIRLYKISYDYSGALVWLIDEGYYVFSSHRKDVPWDCSALLWKNFDLVPFLHRHYPLPLPPQASPAPQGASAPSPSAPVSPKGVRVVDVIAKLEGLAAAHKEKLNWKTSIVDLMKLLGLDSSLVARKELATE